jgi:hypothetical protein
MMWSIDGYTDFAPSLSGLCRILAAPSRESGKAESIPQYSLSLKKSLKRGGKAAETLPEPLKRGFTPNFCDSYSVSSRGDAFQYTTRGTDTTTIAKQ